MERKKEPNFKLVVQTVWEYWLTASSEDDKEENQTIRANLIHMINSNATR